jgi:DNA-directed RNA polymerase specialized sigma subunit
MRHDFLDLVKSGREYKRTEVRDLCKEDEKGDPALEDLADDSLNVFYSLGAAVVERQVYPLLEDAPELKDYIHAVLYGNCSKREDIAAYLGISPQEVTNRHKKLQKRLEPWKIAMEKAGVSKGISHER